MIKQQPQSIDAEKAVLGAILIEKDAFMNVSDLLRGDMFYNSHHQTIYEAICNLSASGQPIDSITVSDKLQQLGQLEKIGGNYYLTSLTNTVVSSAHIIGHARKIVESFTKRELIRIANELTVSAYEGDPFESKEKAEKELHELTVSQSDAKRIDVFAVEVFKEQMKLRDREGYLVGITSGFKSLDNITLGWRESDLVIIAARPAVGKTAFTLSLAVNAAASGVPAAFYSLEMSGKQLTERILASQSKMFLSSIKAARLSDEQMENLFTHGIKKVANYPLYVDDTASMSVGQFKSKLRRLVRKHGVKIAFVDYLQLLKSTLGKNTNRQQQIGDISRELKITAKELQIPIIALSQLSREVEKRKGTPQLSDLREAGDIEQDADMVCFLYGHSEAEVLDNPEKAKEIFYKIAKHRNGALDNLKFIYDKNYQVFTDQGQVPELSGSWKKIEEDNPF